MLMAIADICDNQWRSGDSLQNMRLNRNVRHQLNSLLIGGRMAALTFGQEGWTLLRSAGAACASRP